ncbi:MAG TPA: hypothetical protein DEQ61_19260 [Streptomyces sp.]|nr:hypothetical protein [Streptomyces sp.]
MRLFDDKYSLVVTGVRGHDDWREDVLAIMARTGEDPRGWVALDWDKGAKGEGTQEVATFPFVSPGIESFEACHEITLTSAVQLLVAMTDDWFEVKNIPDFEKCEESLLADARTLLSRYGPDCFCCTTSIDARLSKSPDFSRRASPGIAFTGWLMDLGLIVVSQEEVGVFWSFNAY